MTNSTPAWANGESLQGKYPEGASWDIAIPQFDLVRQLDEAVVKYSDKPALDFMGKTLTYAELGTLISRAAKGLQQMGVGKGSKIGLYMPNTPYYPIMFFAVLRTGATVVNYSPLYTKEELRAQIKDSGTSFMVSLDLKDMQQKAVELMEEGDLKGIVRCPMGDMLPPLKSAAFRLLKRSTIAKAPDDDRVIAFSRLVANDGNYRPVIVDPQDIAVLQYTGGTTGVPKGAMLTHFNLVANCHQIEEFFGARPGRPEAPGLIRTGKEKILAAIPYFHVFGMTTAMLSSLKMGGNHILMPNPRDLDALMKAIDRKGPTLFPAVPRLLQALSEHKHIDDTDFTSLRAVISGGAALPPGAKKAFEAVTAQGIIKQGYGLTETSPAVTCNPPYGTNRSDSVGIAYPKTEIRIADPDNASRTLDIGEVGEILIRGPQVMKGYYNKPEATAEVLTEDGWFLTGDLGYLDSDMYLHIVDRKKRMIIVNGFKVYPNQVEKAISEHPAVAECVVIAVADQSAGEAGKAFIRFRDGADAPTEKELRAFLADKINRIEMPKVFEFVTEELPKTAVGKPDWKKLQDQERQKTAPASPAPKL